MFDVVAGSATLAIADCGSDRYAATTHRGYTPDADICIFRQKVNQQKLLFAIHKKCRSNCSKLKTEGLTLTAHYHTAGDLPETLDFERMARVVSGLEQVMLELAGGEATQKSQSAETREQKTEGQ